MTIGWDQMSPLGKEIARAMERNKLDQTELAQQSGVHQSTISNIVNGKTRQPKAENLEAIAKVLNVPSHRLKLLAGLITEEEAKIAESPPSPDPKIDPEKQEWIDEFYDIFMRLDADDQRRMLEIALWMPQLSDENQELIITMIHKLGGQENRIQT